MGYGFQAVGEMGAVCWRGRNSFGAIEETSDMHMCSAGLVSVLHDPAQVTQLEDSLNFVFEALSCLPPKIAARGEALGQNPCQVVTTFPSLDACNRYADLTHGSLSCYALDVPSWHRPN
jgi:hypothetical protein